MPGCLVSVGFIIIIMFRSALVIALSAFALLHLLFLSCRCLKSQRWVAQSWVRRFAISWHILYPLFQINGSKYSWMGHFQYKKRQNSVTAALPVVILWHSRSGKLLWPLKPAVSTATVTTNRPSNSVWLDLFIYIYHRENGWSCPVKCCIVWTGPIHHKLITQSK